MEIQKTSKKVLTKAAALKIVVQRRKCIEKYRNTLENKVVSKQNKTVKIRKSKESKDSAEKSNSENPILLLSKEKTPNPQLKITAKKRCPKGQYRNRDGNCVPKRSFKALQRLAEVEEAEARSRLKTEDSPRKIYAEKYLTHPVELLGNKYLFQVSFPNIEQFTNYKPLTKHTADCFIQTIFSLGMRCEKTVKEDIQKLRKKKSYSGVTSSEMLNYFEKIFGIERDHFRFIPNVVSFKKPNEGVEKMTKFLDKELENNYATIVDVHLKRKDSPQICGHIMLAYKHNDIVYFFDPQINRLERDPNDMRDDYYVKQYNVFRTVDLKESVELKDSTCSINFSGK